MVTHLSFNSLYSQLNSATEHGQWKRVFSRPTQNSLRSRLFTDNVFSTAQSPRITQTGIDPAQRYPSIASLYSTPCSNASGLITTNVTSLKLIANLLFVFVVVKVPIFTYINVLTIRLHLL